MTTSNPVLCGSIAARPGVFGVAMHSAGYRALGLNYTYVAFGIDDTEAAVAAMRALGIRGLGVTTPHKLRIGAYLDDLTETARAIGAVNTVVNDGGRLVGHNVDWQGAVDAVREGLDPHGRRVAVVGAGGGARAIVYGLVQAGAEVVIHNRDAGRGSDLAASLGARYGGPPSALADADGYDLIAHATPVGFHAPDDMLVPEEALRPGAVVFDAVAVPVRTRLLRTAEARGCRTIPGVRMQLHQAVRQFELYTGRTPPIGILERALAKAMDAAGETARASIPSPDTTETRP
jgi:shikimate dehydrogenase